jgi:drug/metabolite transporter (DMT)-like permease
VLGERTTAVTLWCSVVALVGVAMMFGGSHIARNLDGDGLAFGITQLGLGLLLTAGTKRLSASRVALIGGLDVPLAPIWVWIAFAETPSTATIVGGLTVIVAVVVNTRLGGRRRPARPPEPSTSC